MKPTIRAGDTFTTPIGNKYMAACDEGPGGLVLVAGVIMTVIDPEVCKIKYRATDAERLETLRFHAEHDDGPRGILAKKQLGKEGGMGEPEGH